MQTPTDFSLPTSVELRLLAFRFDGVTVTLDVEDDLGDESRYTIEVRTNLLFSQIGSILNVNSDRFGLQVIAIETVLPLDQHGYYGSPAEHAGMMKAAKLGLCTCIGQKATKTPFALMLKGGLLFCTLPFSGPEAIAVRVER